MSIFWIYGTIENGWKARKRRFFREVQIVCLDGDNFIPCDMSHWMEFKPY